MAWSVLSRFEVLSIAPPYLRRLAEATQQAVNLTIRHKSEILGVQHISRPNAPRGVDWKDRRMPLHKGAAGKALLAHLEDAEIRTHLEEITNAGVPVDVPLLWTEIKQIRNDRFSVNRAELDPNTFAVGAPIFDAGGKCCASVSVAGDRLDFSEGRILEFARLVTTTGDAISTQLGYARLHVVGMA